MGILKKSNKKSNLTSSSNKRKKTKIITKFISDSVITEKLIRDIYQKNHNNLKMFNPVYSDDSLNSLPIIRTKQKSSSHIELQRVSFELFIFYNNFLTKLREPDIEYTEFLRYFRRFGFIPDYLIEEHVIFNHEIMSLMLLFLYHKMKHCNYNLDDPTLFNETINISNPEPFIIRAFNIARIYDYNNVTPEHIIYFLLKLILIFNDRNKLFVLFHQMFPEHSDVIEHIYNNHTIRRYISKRETIEYIIFNNENIITLTTQYHTKIIRRNTNAEETEQTANLLLSLKK